MMFFDNLSDSDNKPIHTVNSKNAGIVSIIKSKLICKESNQHTLKQALGYLCFYNLLQHVKQILYKHLQSGQHMRKQSFKNFNF